MLISFLKGKQVQGKDVLFMTFRKWYDGKIY